jgi:toxin-antitoxin system, antitoxin component, xre family
MLTEFGKITRKLRIDNDVLLKDMAGELNISAAFLSKLETGKSKPNLKLADKIKDIYNLDDKAYNDLINAIDIDNKSIIQPVSAKSKSDMKLIVKLANKLKLMSDAQKQQFIKDIEKL